MKHSILATRYAKELFGFALEANSEKQVFDDLSLIATVLNENKELRLLMLNPLISAPKKQKVFSIIFKEHIGPITLHFLDILIRKGRGQEVVGISTQFKAFFLEHRNLEPVSLTTAIPVNENLKHKILKLVEKLTDKQLEVEEKIDHQIIGGFKIRMGDYLLDASVSNTIARMHKEFDKNLFVKGF